VSIKKKILLIDDSDLVAGVVTEFLENSGYSVFRAVDGVTGIEQAYEVIPDCIIMDVEMPLLKGYQASRLLKAKRGIKNIPIIMHTALSEDKDKYWGRISGADDFVIKDFDNMSMLVEKIEKLTTENEIINYEIIREDSERVDKDYVMEFLSNTFDQKLYQSTILNDLSEVSKSITSLLESVIKIIDLLHNVSECHIVVLHLKYNKEVLSYIFPAQNVYENDVEDFYNITLNDFKLIFPELNPENTEKEYFGVDEREDYKKIRLDNKKISSYMCFNIEGKTEVIGTLHLGNFLKNYFSETIVSNIKVYANGAGLLLENSMLLRHISDMENKIRKMFSKFVPSEIIDDMIGKKDSSSLLIGEKRNVTILFADIRSFTEISENNKPEKVVAFLNSYLEVMVHIIQRHGGTIDKFIGDAILAVFGAPKSYEDNSMRAVKAAQEMIEALETIDCDQIKIPNGVLSIGIGIHEGDVIVGNIGSSNKFDYTVIGDSVNLASRIEGLTKYYHSGVIISQSVKEKLDNKFLLREIDSVRVKGKENPVLLYSLITKNCKFFTNEIIINYNKALNMYKIKNWDTAKEYFQSVLTSVPDDYLCEMFIKRCNKYIENAPEDTWDATINFDFK
jgi:adenylate cyclase